MSGRYAFVTLVTSDLYLPGALAVAAALREVHPSPPVDPEVLFQTVCLVTPETVDVKTIKHLRRAFDSVIGVEVIDGVSTAELQLLGRPDLHSVLTKIHVFRLTQFDKVIFLDADVLPVRPISHLFTLPHEFSAVPDVGWPDIFNSGVMVLSPGEDKFNEIMDIAKTKGSWDGGDQGLLNEWRGSDWNRLSFTYNTTPTAAYTYRPAYERYGSQISVIHFIGENKPWNEIPYRAPSSASQVLESQRQLSGSQQTQTIAATSTALLQSYAYTSLVDRWFDVYDHNYRKLVPATEQEFETRRYENVWDSNAPIRTETATTSALGLEDLRKLALQGGTSAAQPAGEGEYRSLPLEGRFDLMRPRQEIPGEHDLPGSRVESEPPQALVPSEDHIRTPTIAQPHWLGDLPADQQYVSTPGPDEVPPSPLLAPLQLPPSSSVSPVPTTRSLPHDQEPDHDRSRGQPQDRIEVPPHISEAQPVNVEYHAPTQQSFQTHDSNRPPPGEPPRPASPPLISWNPAIEPPPNVTPTPSAFPADAYFPNAWDLPVKPGHAGSTSISSQFFEPPPQAQIPQQLISEGHYKDVMGPKQDTSQPDMSRVTSIFPWEQRPRHIPGRVFPQGETAPPGVQYIENLPPTEPEQESELLTPDTTHEEKVQVASPHTQIPSPPIGFPGARGYANAWDSIPSIQKYAARLVKPSSAVPALTILPPRMRKRTDSYRSRSEQSDANSMDGDVEDEIDDNESEAGAGGRFSSSERSTGGRSRSSRASVGSPPSGTARSRTSKKEYRSYGVQTVPKEVRSVAVQVSEEFSTPTGKSSAKSTMPQIQLPMQPVSHEFLVGPEPTTLATPSTANVQPFFQGPSSHQQHITPSGMVSPRLHEPYIIPPLQRTGSNASPGSQSPVTRRQAEKMNLPQLSTEQPQSMPGIVVRTSSQESPDSPLGPVSPVDAPAASQPRKPAGRRWNPATGVDVFKRSSEEVLARFLRLGSWEDDTQSSSHAHG